MKKERNTYIQWAHKLWYISREVPGTTFKPKFDKKLINNMQSVRTLTANTDKKQHSSVKAKSSCEINK